MSRRRYGPAGQTCGGRLSPEHNGPRGCIVSRRALHVATRFPGPRRCRGRRRGLVGVGRADPENLQEAGVSWKVYQNKDLGPLSRMDLDGMLGCFTQYADPGSVLAQRGLDPVFPAHFEADVWAGTLPAVSWIVPSIFTCEHPALPPTGGAVGIVQVLDILTSNPAVWEDRADRQLRRERRLLRPRAAAHTAAGHAGRISDRAAGAGRRVGRHRRADRARVPGAVPGDLAVQPRGRVASEVFDHTSQLRLVEQRFGAPAPNSARGGGPPGRSRRHEVSRGWQGVRALPRSAYPSQSSTAAAVQDCCMLPSGSPVNGS